MSETTDLMAEIEAAEARLAQLKLQMKQGPCREYGHDWVFHGGCNAGCDETCGCSVPVNVCSKCGDCDYGDNDEADGIRAKCALTEAA